jgi:hypothetical protein
VEHHNCSSDNGSLDGVCIPQVGIALMDGTAPHIVDPKNPGAVDQIIHLGDYWNEDLLIQNKEAILVTNKRVGRFFQMAYFSLREAKAIMDEWESYITESMDFARVNEFTVFIEIELLSWVTPDFRRNPKARHLFATAITPDGPKNYLDTVLQDIKKLFVIKGAPGSGKATLIKNIADKARIIGLDTELYHCSFVPQNIDILVIPQLFAAVANLAPPVTFDPNVLANLKSCTEINLSGFSDKKILSIYTDEINSCKTRFDAAFNRAVQFLSKAKAEHDVMESYYVPAMNFTAINAKRDEILERILKYIPI